MAIVRWSVSALYSLSQSLIFTSASAFCKATRDEATGFYTDDDAPVWVKGCECQVEKFIPAKQRLGTDGQMYSYTFDVFLPSYFEGDLSIGARVEVTLERGGVDEFTISGIDDTNPKYIEIWG